MVTVGLSVGGGTGPELCAVFARAVEGKVELLRDPVAYRTYAGVSKLAPADAARAAAEDAASYERFLLSLPARGVRAVFRTAFNAQSIYLVRERLRSVKVEDLSFAGGRFLLIRDQAQGFYAGANDEASPDKIVRRCEFSREVTERVLDFAAAEAGRRWGGAAPRRWLMAYKYHLLDTRFAGWVEDYARRHGVTIELSQPDTMNRALLGGGLTGNILIVGSNEWLDIVHAELLARHDGGVHDERFAVNRYLDPRLADLWEYQTVHGSADDIAGKGIVNPKATLRCAAAILERHAGVSGAEAALEKRLASV